MAFLRGLPDDATVVDVYKTYPAVAAAALALNDAVMRQPAPFTPAEREAIAAYVSTINSCRYCQGVHTNAAVNLGLAPERVSSVCERPDQPDDPRLAPVLAYVAKLTDAPATVTQADVDKVLEAGWDETAVSYAAFIAGLYAFMNRLVEGHGVRGTAEQLEAGGKRVAELGYAGMAKMLGNAK